MTPDQVTALMDQMMEQARATPKKDITRMVPYSAGSGEVPVTAQANSIGFVYWTYNSRPMPRTAVKAILDITPAPPEERIMTTQNDTERLRAEVQTLHALEGHLAAAQQEAIKLKAPHTLDIQINRVRVEVRNRIVNLQRQMKEPQ